MKYSLVGIDGNAFCVIAYVAKCMKREGKTKTEINKYREKAKSGDYHNLLAVSIDMIDELNGDV